MKNILKKSLLITAAVSVFAWPVYADVIDNVEKSFSVNADSKFSLNNINGSVEITSWQEPTIKIEATIEADNQDERDRVEIKMKQNGQHVQVLTDYEESSGWGN